MTEPEMKLRVGQRFPHYRSMPRLDITGRVYTSADIIYGLGNDRFAVGNSSLRPEDAEALIAELRAYVRGETEADNADE